MRVETATNRRHSPVARSQLKEKPRRHRNNFNKRMPMKPKLLVVDDDHSVRESLKKLLETEHYDVHPARNAVDALEHFRSNQTDLVILDLNLGTYDGWKVFHTMAAQTPCVPTVIIPAAFDHSERAVANGAEALMDT